jgi:hypothetical protein
MEEMWRRNRFGANAERDALDGKLITYTRRDYLEKKPLPAHFFPIQAMMARTHQVGYE